MEASNYKDFTTKRGLKYHYYFHAPAAGKPILLLLHGFPSLSTSWAKQVPFFEQHGYGLIVPDLLGYGGSDKPYDPALYRFKAMSQDIVELLDSENAHNVISIGHDWGAGLNSRIAVYHQDRFIAFGNFAVGFMPPSPDFDIDALNEATEKALGRPMFGYWLFFNEDNCHEVLAAHTASSFSLSFAADPNLWATAIAPVGAFKKWLLEDKIAEIASWVTDEDKEYFARESKQMDFRAATCWYKCPVRKLNNPDEKEIPEEKYHINKPFFFGAALRDGVCVASVMKLDVEKYCKNATIKEFDADHWVIMSAPKEVNEELLRWLEGLKI